MDFLIIILAAAATFGVCFLLDRLFTKKFRNRKEHKTGLAVRMNKRYGAFGIIMIALGCAAIFAALNGNSWLLAVAGGVIILCGIGLIVYYLTFGVYYAEDTFLLNTFGKRGVRYQYRDIVGQQLYNASGNILIELHLKDGRTVGLQSTMTGVYPFLDYAFAAWCRQTGTAAESCEFHDPQSSLWFPPVEV